VTRRRYRGALLKRRHSSDVADGGKGDLPSVASNYAESSDRLSGHDLDDKKGTATGTVRPQP